MDPAPVSNASSTTERSEPALPDRQGGEVRRPRLDSLTGLRWWAAFGVFFFHMRVFAPVPVLNHLAVFGNYGVAFFFILSGFVLTWSAQPGTTTGTFWWRRFARIYPAHFVALLLAIPVFYSFAPDPHDWWVKPFSAVLLLSVLLIQGWWLSPGILFSGNPAAWTLTVEFFFYFIHPWINRGLRRLSSRGALVATLAVVAAMILYRVGLIVAPGSWLAQLPVPIARVSEFLLGMGVAQMMLTGRRFRVPAWLCFSLGAAFVLWQATAVTKKWHDPFSHWGAVFSNEIIIVLFALTIGAVAGNDIRQKPSWLRSRPLVRLGEWSFCFYLVHATAMYVFMEVFGPQKQSVSNLLWWYPSVFVVALVAAWALHAVVEKPLERRMRRWWDRRQASSSAGAAREIRRP